MKRKEIILYSILPHAEGYLEGMASGLEHIGDFNKEGAATGLRKIIDSLKQIRQLLCEDEMTTSGFAEWVSSIDYVYDNDLKVWRDRANLATIGYSSAELLESYENRTR